MFETDDAERALIAAGVAVDPAALRAGLGRDASTRVLRRGPRWPGRPAAWMQRGGRAGRHTEHLGHLLAEMQYLQRTYPGATW